MGQQTDCVPSEQSCSYLYIYHCTVGNGANGVSRLSLASCVECGSQRPFDAVKRPEFRIDLQILAYHSCRRVDTSVAEAEPPALDHDVFEPAAAGSLSPSLVAPPSYFLRSPSGSSLAPKVNDLYGAEAEGPGTWP